MVLMDGADNTAAKKPLPRATTVSKQSAVPGGDGAAKKKQKPQSKLEPRVVRQNLRCCASQVFRRQSC